MANLGNLGFVIHWRREWGASVLYSAWIRQGSEGLALGSQENQITGFREEKIHLLAGQPHHSGLSVLVCKMGIENITGAQMSLWSAG